MKKGPDSKKVKGGPATAIEALFKDIGKISLMSREEEVERAAEMVRFRDERDRLTECMANKNQEDISKEEKQELQKAQRNYEKVRNIFVIKNLRLVVKMAKKYTKMTGVELTALISEGSIGLMQAADKFDPGRGVRFITYAGWWVRNAMNRTLQQKARIVRRPVHVEELSHKIRKIQAEAFVLGQEEPTIEELSELLGKKVEVIKRAMKTDPRSVSLDAPINDDFNNGSYIDYVSDDDCDPQDEALDTKRNTEHLYELLESLDAREQKIVKLRYGLDEEDTHTLQEIGDQFQLSRERVRQIEATIQAKLKKKLIGVIEAPEVA